MMDRIIVTAADIEKLLAWRDERKELVRSMPVPLREVKIQVVENGISIKCFRSDKKLKFYLDSAAQSSALTTSLAIVSAHPLWTTSIGGPAMSNRMNEQHDAELETGRSI